MTRVWRTIAAVFATAAIAALGTASAASLGPVRSRGIAAFRSTGTVPTTTTIPPTTTTTIPPTTTTTLPPGVKVLTCDTFTLSAPTGNNLDGRLVQPPGTCGTYEWAVHHGDWVIQAGGALSVISNRSVATIAYGAPNVSAQATVLNANVATAQSGVAIDYSMTSKNFLVGAINGSGMAQLLMVTNSGDPVVLASSTASITGNDVIRITRNGTKVTVSLNGTIRITYTLSGAQVSSLASGIRTGLYFNYNNTNAVRFMNFQATSATAP
jgi:hypothetical protein